MDLDDTDRALVEALLVDSSASTQDLATEIGVDAAAVERRIDRLEDAGVLEGHTVRVDYDKLGYDVTAVVRVRTSNGPDTVSGTLGAYPWARSVYEVTGEDDFLLVGRFRDTDDMHGNVAELLTEPAIKSVTVDVVVDAVRSCEPLPLETSSD